jgi:hypothetical protein
MPQQRSIATGSEKDIFNAGFKKLFELSTTALILDDEALHPAHPTLSTGASP